MAVAAIPAYLGKDFTTASPGMRFGMYLAVWQQHGWSKEKTPKWDAICKMSNERALTASLLERQSRLASLSGDDALLALPAQSTAPFVTGMGNEHPLENGFAFLWPYGIPYLPGSGIKGVLRQAVRELISNDWGDNVWTSINAQIAPGSSLPLGETSAERATSVLFGLEGKDGGQEHLRGVLNFWDVIPEIKGNKLMVEIMTPHQSHYYQNGEPPHDSGMPTPISFLTVPPGSSFPFHITCDTARLSKIAPKLLQEQDGTPLWKALMQAAFEHAFDWCGFGAKTAVGYGAMYLDKQRQEEQRRQREEERLAAKKEADLNKAVAGLPDDAAWIEKQRVSDDWSDNNKFLAVVAQFLDKHETLSTEAQDILCKETEFKWKGIMSNPDATQGKKKKAKYSRTPKELAKRLLAYKAQGNG